MLLRLLPLIVLAALLGACEADAPDCAGVSPAHVTTEGVARVGPLVVGETAQDVILLQTSPLSGVTESVHQVVFDVTADDSGGTCEMDLECGPDQIDVGEDITCDVTNTSAQPGCTWTAEVGVTVTHFNPDVCSEVFVLNDIEAEAAAR